MKLIDADALIDNLELMYEHRDDKDEPYNIGVRGAINMTRKAPSIDIVRCKECVHCADDWNGNQPMFTCELGRCGESVQPNDFCSYGEVRDE